MYQRAVTTEERAFILGQKGQSATNPSATDDNSTNLIIYAGLALGAVLILSMLLKGKKKVQVVKA